MSYFGQQEFIPFIPNTKRFCQDWVAVGENDMKRVSLNQQLTGNAPHPKFVTPPYIAAPSHDLNAWRASDLVTHSHINDSSNLPEGDSGYAYMDTGAFDRSFHVPLPTQPGEGIQMQALQPGIYKDSIVSQPIHSMLGISMTPQFPHESVEYGDGYTLFKDLLESDKESFTPAPSHSSLPRVPYYRMKGAEPSKETKTLLPPLKFPPRMKGAEASKETKTLLPPLKFPPGPESVYDPRTSTGGPGDAKMTTYNKLLGRIDQGGYDAIVNEVRRPSTLIRSNVDIFDWADGVGAFQQNTFASTNGDTIREKAHDQWLNDTNDFRASLTNSQMRKKNAEMVQRRIFPIRPF